MVLGYKHCESFTVRNVGAYVTCGVILLYLSVYILFLSCFLCFRPLAGDGFGDLPQIMQKAVMEKETEPKPPIFQASDTIGKSSSGPAVLFWMIPMKRIRFVCKLSTPWQIPGAPQWRRRKGLIRTWWCDQAVIYK